MVTFCSRGHRHDVVRHESAIIVSGHYSVVELQRYRTLKDVAFSLAYPELEGILIAQGICPSECADFCHTPGYQTYRIISHT